MKKITILVILFMLFNSYQALGQTSRSIIVNSGWQYLSKTTNPDRYVNVNYVLNQTDLNWTNYPMLNKPQYAAPSGEVWVRVKLPEGNFRDPSILFMTYDQIFEMYLDKKLIYKFGSFTNTSKLKSPGSPWHIISLPNNYKNKFIYMKMYSVRKVNLGLVKKFELGSKSTSLESIVRDGIFPFVQSCLYLFAGLFSLLFAIFSKSYRKVFLLLGICAAVTSSWLISEGTVKQIFFNNPVFWVYVDIVSQYSIPIVYTLLINELFEGKYKRILRTIVYTHLLILIFALGVDILNIVPIVATLPVFYIGCGISAIILIIIIGASFKKWNDAIKIFAFGFSIICICTILDIVNSANRNHSNIIYTQAGISIFLISLVLLSIYHVIKTEDNAHKYLIELNEKNAALLERKRLLEQAIINDKLKTEFFANISHELKTPLNIILSATQLLYKFTEDDLITSTEKDLYRYLNIMKQNSFRLIRLVNNLIDMTKIDSGFFSVDFKNNDIVAVVEDITQSVAEYIKAKGISITFDTNVEEKIIACDPDKIERIILNLLSNSVKFSKPGSSIFVEIRDKDTQVEIRVSDTGIGIKKDKLEAIFERFVQVDKSFTRNHEGSGIGLSLVKSLVELHGGKISVNSEYGKGSIFTIVIPAKTVEFVNEEIHKDDIPDHHVEKVNIEFSDIYS